MIGMLLTVAYTMGPTVPAVQAEVLAEETDENYRGEKVKLYLDQNYVGDEKLYGLRLDDTIMIPCYGFLQNIVGMEVQFSPEEGTLLLKNKKEWVSMKLGEKCAYTEDGKALQLDYAPFKDTSVANEEPEVYVPVSVISEYLHYAAYSQLTTDEQWELQMTSPLVYQQGGEEKCYAGDRIEKIVFNSKTVDLSSDIPGIVIDHVLMVPLEEAVANKKVNGIVTVTGSGILAKRGGYTLLFEEESDLVEVNGSKQYMEGAAQTIVYKDKSYFMVPAKQLFSMLGAESVSINYTEHSLNVTKKKGTYLLWKPDTSDLSGNLVEKVTVKYNGSNDKVLISCGKTPQYKVSSNKTQIKLTIKNVRIAQNYDESVLDGRYVKNMTMKQSGKNVIVTVKKKSGVDYIFQCGSGKLILMVHATPIRIAVDCGHGANTPGKRTPKMPCNIDFDGDGVIDVKKGRSIREHQGNVGVGRYVASELERLGFRVYRSAFGSTDVSLSGRQRNIRKFHAKYSVSIHFNAVGTGRTFNNVQGYEVYYHSQYTRQSKTMAQKVLKEMGAGTRQTNRGVRGARLALCNTTAMGTQASILVECAFMTNLREAKLMGSKAYWKETGEEIAKGICKFAGVDYIKK